MTRYIVIKTTTPMICPLVPVETSVFYDLNEARAFVHNCMDQLKAVGMKVTYVSDEGYGYLFTWVLSDMNGEVHYYILRDSSTIDMSSLYDDEEEMIGL